MPIELRPNAFNPWQELENFHNTLTTQTGKYGATACFIGTMRDFNIAAEIKSMYLEYYPGMTETALNGIVAETSKQWRILDFLLLHRTGDILPNDTIVVITVYTAHRQAAFESCRFIMEQLKSKAPFWKKEMLADGTTRWVEKNTAG